jgi:GDP-L-fucose synthase
MSADRLKALGWSPSITLRDGLTSTYAWYRANIGAAAPISL